MILPLVTESSTQEVNRSFNLISESTSFVKISSNTVYVTAIQPPVNPSNELVAMAAYLLTISSPTRDISNLITDDSLRSVRYIGERQSIGVPHSAPGGTFATLLPSSADPATSAVNTEPMRTTPVAPPENGDGAQDQTTTSPGRVSNVRTPEDGENTESDTEFLRKIFFPSESLSEIPQPETTPTLGEIKYRY